MSDTVQQIKDRLSIVDVVKEHVKLERGGANLRARCPFHAERTPSFFVSPDRGTFHCFGCGVGGDIFTFVQMIEGIDFKGALMVLAEKAGVQLVYSRGAKEDKDERDRLFELMEVATIFYASQLNDEVGAYLRTRGIDGKTADVFRIGWAGQEWNALSKHLEAKGFSDKEMLEAGVARRSERGGMTDKFRNRIMFPIADSAGRMIGFSGRIFPGTASPSEAAGGQAAKTDGAFEPPKYLNSPETPLFHKSRVLYGLHKAKSSMRKHACAVLVEGQLDLLASHQAGWGNTVAVSGTAFTSEHATLVRRFADNLVIALDPDEAGIKAAGRAARAALSAGLNVKVARLPVGLDPADLVLKEGKEAWSSAIREAKDIITFLLDVLEERSKGADWFRRTVESAVLPYVADVQSPIAREHYLREIADRLDVSIQAVQEALEKVPRTPGSDIAYQRADEARLRSGGSGEALPDRAALAYSIVLWQRTLPKHTLDLDVYERELEEALPVDTLERLRALPEEEQEKLRFEAERLYGRSVALQAEMQSLLTVLLKERLSQELLEATRALKEAEKSGNDETAAVYMSVCNVLTRRIARLHEVL